MQSSKRDRSELDTVRNALDKKPVVGPQCSLYTSAEFAAVTKALTCQLTQREQALQQAVSTNPAVNWREELEDEDKLHAVLLKYKQHDFKCPEAVFSEEETAVWSVG